MITDIKMPDMDGIDAATQIYRNGPIPVILVSAYHDPEFIRRAEADHILAYLVKPIKQADLEPAIAIAMRRFEQFQALRKEATDLKQALEDHGCYHGFCTRDVLTFTVRRLMVEATDSASVPVTKKPATLCMQPRTAGTVPDTPRSWRRSMRSRAGSWLRTRRCWN